MKRLIEIQQGLKAPKNQKNSFGGYNYRSCEDILEAVKPLLKKQGLALVINDDITAMEGRFYVKATATLFDEEGKQIAQTSAFAREEDTKKGMDASQLTGSTSSYARKYALNGLFAIDDTKDADATNTHDKEGKKKDEFIPDVLKNDDTDIYAGLTETTDGKSALEYFLKYKKQVNDQDAFREAWQEHAKKLEGIK
jgi:hypothetical protein